MDLDGLLDLEVHVFKGKEFLVWHGAVEVVLVAVIPLVTEGAA